MTREEDALNYLVDGGLAEVFGMADICQKLGEPKVQMDTAMALALCRLANDGLDVRRMNTTKH